jgi:FkbM family methyltransferase
VKFDTVELARVLYREIITTDVYQLQHIDATKVRTVIDIGANVGLFSVRARMLFPHATVFAYEPSPSTFAMLKENTEHLKINCRQLGLGRAGTMLEMRKQGPNSSQNQFREGEIGDAPAHSFVEILTGHDLTSTVVKVDAEGAEMNIINDPAAIPLLRQLLCFTAEFHFGKAFATPEWAAVHEPWAKNVFEKTHDVSVSWKTPQHTTTNAFTAHLKPRK